MSKTPRTDEQILHHDNGNGHPSDFVFASFARQLETELAEALAEIEKATTAEAERWAERLNWLHTKHGADCSGTDSADLLDCVEDEIKQVINKQSELIEQMREALKTVVSSAPPGGPLWYGSAEIVKAVAAIKAAERDE